MSLRNNSKSQNPFLVYKEKLPKSADFDPKKNNCTLSIRAAINSGAIMGQGSRKDLISALHSLFNHAQIESIESAFENLQATGFKSNLISAIGDGAYYIGDSTELGPKENVDYKNSALPDIIHEVLQWAYPTMEFSEPLTLTQLEELAQEYWVKVLRGKSRKRTHPQNINLENLQQKSGIEYEQYGHNSYKFKISGKKAKSNIQNAPVAVKAGVLGGVYIGSASDFVTYGITNNFAKRESEYKKYNPSFEMVQLFQENTDSNEDLKTKCRALYERKYDQKNRKLQEALSNLENKTSRATFETIVKETLKQNNIEPKEGYKEIYELIYKDKIMKIVEDLAVEFGFKKIDDY